MSQEAGIDYHSLLKMHDLDHVAPAQANGYEAPEDVHTGPFCLYMNLGSHNAAVYAARFSPSGCAFAAHPAEGR